MVITTREVGDVTVIDVEGDIKRSQVVTTTLHQVVKSRLEEGQRNFALNFEKMDFIDSYGVGEIIASYHSINSLGGELKLARISKKLRIVFEITKLIDILEVTDSIEAALESFGRGGPAPTS